ncbi:DNA primase [Pseudomonas syringae]|nr:DNA primase [Pseudomonas syringae]
MKTSEFPVWLAVPPDDRDKARASAGTLPNGRPAIVYDKEAQLWCARPGCDLSKVNEWLPDRSRRAGGGDPEGQFLDALTQAGLIIKGMPIMDGNKHRVKTVEDKSGKQGGVYCGFLDGRPAGWFTNFHRANSASDTTKWVSTGGESDPLTSLHIRAGAKQGQEDAARERAALHAKNTKAAKRLYDRLPPADPAHPYLVRKGITPTPEIRQTNNGSLVVPFFNAKGAFRTLQYIQEDGGKSLFKDAPKQEHFLVVGGPLNPQQPFLYAEGYATARSLNMATDLPVVMTIDAGNMVAVAKLLSERYPGSQHLFMADFDHAKKENKGLIMATQAAEQVGGDVLYPAFNSDEIARNFSDFNDLHHSRGLDAVREQTAPLIQRYSEAADVQQQTSPERPEIAARPAESLALPVADVPGPAQPAAFDNKIDAYKNEVQTPAESREPQPTVPSAPTIGHLPVEQWQTELTQLNQLQIEVRAALEVARAELHDVQPDRSAEETKRLESVVDEHSTRLNSIEKELKDVWDDLKQAASDPSTVPAQPVPLVATSTETPSPAPAVMESVVELPDLVKPAEARAVEAVEPEPTRSDDASMAPTATAVERGSVKPVEPSTASMPEPETVHVESIAPAAPVSGTDATPVVVQLNATIPVDMPQTASEQEPLQEATVLLPVPPAPGLATEAAKQYEAPFEIPDLPVMQRPVTAAEMPAQAVADTIEVGARIGKDTPSTTVPASTGDIDKDALLARITREPQGDTVLYKLDAEPAFHDRGSRLEMVPGASQNDEKVMAALLTAAQFYRGHIELTGSDAFKAKAIGLIAEHQINVTMKNPVQQMMLEQARERLGVKPVVPEAVHGDTPPPFEPKAAAPTVALGKVNVANDPPALTPVVPALATQSVPAQPIAPMEIKKPDASTPQAAAPVAAVPAKPAVLLDPAIHQSPQAAEKGITGKVMSFGPAPYRFDASNAESIHIKLRTKAGTQTFWGKELAGLLRETRIQPGRMATLHWMGQQPLTLKVPIKENGVTVRFEEKTTHRNQWSLALLNGPTVRTGTDEGVKLGAYDAARFAMIQTSVMAQLNVPIDTPVLPNDGLFWMTPNGQGSAKAGDELSAPRPTVEAESAGKLVMSSWSKDGHLDMALFRGDGPYLQGVIRQEDRYQHVLVSLPAQQGAPAMVFNTVNEHGLTPIGTGNGINRSGGQPVQRDHVAFKLEGDAVTRIAKLDHPGQLPPALHSRLGFDERWKDDNALPKSSPVPAAAPSARPSDMRPS